MKEIKPSKEGIDNMNNFINQQEQLINANSELLKTNHSLLQKIPNMQIDEFDKLKEIAILQTKGTMKLAKQFNDFYGELIKDVEDIIKTGKAKI